MSISEPRDSVWRAEARLEIKWKDCLHFLSIRKRKKETWKFTWRKIKKELMNSAHFPFKFPVWFRIFSFLPSTKIKISALSFFFYLFFFFENSTRRFLTMPSGPRRLATTPPLGNRRPLTQVKRYGFEVRAPPPSNRKENIKCVSFFFLHSWVHNAKMVRA